MKQLQLILFLFFLLGCSTGDDNDNRTDKLNPIGILGNWKINDRSFDGITPLIVVCCEFIEFKADENKQDLSGLYNWSSGQFRGSGIFTIDNINQALILQDENDEDVYEFIISESGQEFLLNYLDNETLISESWIKIN